MTRCWYDANDDSGDYGDNDDNDDNDGYGALDGNNNGMLIMMMIR